MAQVTQHDAAGLYDRMAGVYDVWAWLTESKARAHILRLANVTDGESVLEVAVGTGLAFAEVVRANPHGQNIGIDISKGMLAKARERLTKADFANFDISIASAFDIPRPDASFDVVMNNYMFDLMAEEDWPRVLGEFYRLLIPGGRLVLSGMTPGQRFGSGFYDRLYNLSPRLMGGCRGVRMEGPVTNAGFEVISREYVQQMLFPSEVILARKS